MKETKAREKFLYLRFRFAITLWGGKMSGYRIGTFRQKKEGKKRKTFFLFCLTLKNWWKQRNKESEETFPGLSPAAIFELPHMTSHRNYQCIDLTQVIFIDIKFNTVKPRNSITIGLIMMINDPLVLSRHIFMDGFVITRFHCTV